jgi:hypothetical protein
LISVFEPTWTASDIDAMLSYWRVGIDRPYAYLGAVQLPGDGSLRYLYLRVGLNGIPSSPVVRIDDSVQYASSVVNIVVPTFDDSRVGLGANGFDVVAAAQRFYQYFGDVDDVLAFTPEATPVTDFGAFHRNVRNAVAGINIGNFDSSRSYGSNGVLQGIEVYGASTAARYEDTDHEMAHQWASNFDWTRIAAIARAGHQPSSHSPLWTGGETLIGAVLLGNRRVAAPAAGGYAVEQTPAPAHFHPIELYAMGLLSADRVPDFQLFADQSQFDANAATAPDVGAAVTGAVQPASIADVVRVHGSRTGPAISSLWRRATVLVSRNRLASQQEMDYWNFFAQRLGDRNHASRSTLDNFVSFRRATGGAVDVATAIQPRAAAPEAETLEIDTPAYGASDWRGISLTSPLPSRFVAGQTVTVTGRVTAPDAVDFTSVTLGFWA